jgi:AraC family transcriptional regulator
MTLENLDSYRTVASVEGRGLFCRQIAYLPGSSQPFHAHENARFVFLLKGSFAERCERKTRSYSPFTVLFRPPQERHSDKYGTEEVVCISVDVALSWLEDLRDGGVQLPESIASVSAPLSAIAVKLGMELAIRDAASPLAVEALLTEAAVDMARQRTGAIGLRPPLWLERATALIQDEHARNLSLTDVSLAAGVHPAHLARVFRRFHRCTIGEYLRKVRVEAACKQLVSSDATVAAIALGLGFGDQSHLCRTFKRITGTTPMRYRQLIRVRKPHPKVHR